jgi:hypothetical protein
MQVLFIASDVTPLIGQLPRSCRTDRIWLWRHGNLEKATCARAHTNIQPEHISAHNLHTQAKQLTPTHTDGYQSWANLGGTGGHGLSSLSRADIGQLSIRGVGQTRICKVFCALVRTLQSHGVCVGRAGDRL